MGRKLDDLRDEIQDEIDYQQACIDEGDGGQWLNGVGGAASPREYVIVVLKGLLL